MRRGAENWTVAASAITRLGVTIAAFASLATCSGSGGLAPDGGRGGLDAAPSEAAGGGQGGAGNEGGQAGMGPGDDAASGDTGGAANDGGQTVDVGTSIDGGSCNAVVNVAPVIYAFGLPTSEPPCPQGGVPSPGMYYLNGWTRFALGGPAGRSSSLALQETAEVTVSNGNVVTMQIVQNDGPGTADVHQTLQLTLTGSTGHASYTCPFSGIEDVGITATDTVFKLYFVGPDGPEENSFAKQP
jgi:hypothetical protein